MKGDGLGMSFPCLIIWNKTAFNAVRLQDKTKHKEKSKPTLALLRQLRSYTPSAHCLSEQSQSY